MRYAPDDVNGVDDVWVFDRDADAFIRVSESSDGEQGNGTSLSHALSADGRYVSFSSEATNLGPIVPEVVGQVYLYRKDLQTGAIDWVDERAIAPEAAIASSVVPAISADGRFVAFTSTALDLVDGVETSLGDVYLRDMESEGFTLISQPQGGGQANFVSYASSVSEDGRFVGFNSGADNLLPSDTNGNEDFFVADREEGTITRPGTPLTGEEFSRGTRGRLNPAGDHVVYTGQSGPFAADRNLFVRNLTTGDVDRVDVPTEGFGPATPAISPVGPSMSDDGRYVVFMWDRDGLVPGDNNTRQDTFIRDRVDRTTMLTSSFASGGPSNNGAHASLISGDGQTIAVTSSADLAGDSPQGGVYVRPRSVSNVLDVTAEELRPGMTATISVSGSNLPAGSMVTVGGVVASSTTRKDAHTLEASVTLPSDMEIGTYPVVVTLPDTCTLTLENGVEVVEHLGDFHPLDPTRILDTRTGVGGLSKIGQSAVVDVAGQGGVPETGAGAVVMNVTVTEPTRGSWVTIYPNGEATPLASNLNFLGGQTVANLVTVKLGSDGKVAVHNDAGSTHLIFDVVGWYADITGPQGARYHPITPGRLLDTRLLEGGPLGEGEIGDLPVAGYGVPDEGASAVVLNVTAVGATAGSYLTVWPGDTEPPLASNVNFVRGATVPNLVVVPVAADGFISIFNAVGQVHVIVDVVGWYDDGTEMDGSSLNPLSPARLLDTRDGTGAQAGKVGPNGTVSLQVTGRGGVPGSGVSAVILNVTVTQPDAGSFVTVFPSGVDRPIASNLNFVGGQTVPNLVVVKVGAGGKVDLYNATSPTHLIADVVGYYG